ncbi:MAG: hypothetical protein VKP57_13030 [Candidatus Sericytochromatia bacterium]|nr:hypothetical protein [Candidatus Sericytochromatia bacterium]
MSSIQGGSTWTPSFDTVKMKENTAVPQIKDDGVVPTGSTQDRPVTEEVVTALPTGSVDIDRPVVDRDVVGGNLVPDRGGVVDNRPVDGGRVPDYATAVETPNRPTNLGVDQLGSDPRSTAPELPRTPVNTVVGGIGQVLDRVNNGERGDKIAGDLSSLIDKFKDDPALQKLLMKLYEIAMGQGNPYDVAGLVKQIDEYMNSKAKIMFPQHEPWEAIVQRPDGSSERVSVPPGTTEASYNANPFPLNTSKGPATAGGGTGTHDPLKITLDGTDAKVNTTDNSQIRLDDGREVTMSGGLNDNEAWLVKDRNGDGTSKNNGVIDGNEIFGDHLGKFKNAYDELAHEYAAELKTDEQGRKYIDLADPNSVAAKELKLMDKAGNYIHAADKLQKLYVTWDEVNIQAGDGQTSLRQQALVQYNDGKVAKSADQWFGEKQAA